MDFDRAIVEAYYALLAIARRQYYHDGRAHDLAADTVMRALEARDRYDGRPLLAWCRAIMRNLFLNERQRLSTTCTQRLGEWNEPGGVEADQRAIVDDILTAVGDMERRSVAVGTLMDFARGYSLQEIATARSVPLGTVKRRIHDARKMLSKSVYSLR